MSDDLHVGELWVDDSSGYVGIGTTNPSYPLQVADSGGYSAYFASNVGIGAINASYSLYVNGATFINNSITASLYRADQGTAAAPVFISGLDTDTGIYFPTGNDTLGFSTGGTERLRIDSSGYVGIGNSVPDQMLTVAGNILASSSYMTGGFFASGSSEFDNTVSISNDFSVFGDDVLFKPFISKEDSFIIASAGWISGDDYGPLFGVNTNTASISIDGGVEISKDFNVASGALQYDYTTGVTNIDSLQAGEMSFDTDAGIVTWVDMPIATIATGLVESYIAQLGGNPMLTIYGLTDGSGGVNNLGVGIGDTTPGYTLSVDGTASISDALYVGGASTSVNFIEVGTSSVSQDLYIDNDVYIGGTLYGGSPLQIGSDIEFVNDAVINSSASISQDFSVNELFYVNIASSSMEFTGTGSASFTSPFNINNDFDVSGGDLFVDHSSGYVGIGDTAPTYKLSVDGTASISGPFTFGAIATPSSGVEEGMVFYENGAKELYVYNGSGWQNLASAGGGTGTLDGSGAGTHIAYWSDSDTLTYDSDGNFFWDPTNNYLGIGDATPDAKLDVEGSASISQDFSVGDSLLYVNVGSSSMDFTRASVSDSLTAADIIRGGILTDGTLSITGGDITSGDLLSFAYASVSQEAQMTSASFNNLAVTTGLELPDGSVLEADLDIANNPADNYLLFYNSAAGKLDYITSTVSWDSNTIYTAASPLSLVGTEFDIDLASTSGPGYLSNTDWDTFSNKLGQKASTSFIWSPAGGNTFEIDGLASVSGNIDFNSVGLALNIGNSGTNFTTGGGLTLAGNLSGVGASLSDDLDLIDLNVTSASAGTLNVGTLNATTIPTLSTTHASVSDDFETNYANITSASIGNTFNLGTNQLWTISATSTIYSSASWGIMGTDFAFDGTASLSGPFYLGGNSTNQTNQLWTTSPTSSIFSSASWQLVGNFDVDGIASLSIASISNYIDFGDIATPSEVLGRVFHDTGDNSLLYYNGTGWQNLASAGGGTGTLDGTGASTHIAYWSDSDTLTYDSDGNFFWDPTNNYLGIGDASPDAKLDIEGGASVSQDFSVGDSLLYVNVGSSSMDFTRASISDSLTAADIIRGGILTDGTLSITGGDITSGDLLSFAYASVSQEAQMTSASFNNLAVTTGLELPDGSVLEADLDIANNPADNYLLFYNSAAGKLDYITSTVSWDNNTTYEFNNPLSLVGTGVSIDYASGSGGGYLTSDNWNTFSNKLDQKASTSFIWSPTTLTNAFEIDGLASVSGLASFYGGLVSSGSANFDNIVSISGPFYLGGNSANQTNQLWTTSPTSSIYSSASWQIVGNFDVDGAASLSSYLDFGTLATPSEVIGRVFRDADNSLLYSTDGSTWQNLASPSASGLSGGSDDYIGIWSGGDSMTYDAGLYYDSSSDRLGIGVEAASTPGYTLTVDGTASISGDFDFGGTLLVGRIADNGVSISGDLSIDTIFWADSSADRIEMGVEGSDVYIGTAGVSANLLIERTGRVGIGTEAIIGELGYDLMVDGTASVSGKAYFPYVAGKTTIGTAAITGELIDGGASDLRLKKNINDIDSALGKLLTLRGVSFNWKTQEEGNFYATMDDTVNHLGFIAQEVASSAIPDLAYSFDYGGQEIYGVREIDMMALVVESIKDMNKVIDLKEAPIDFASLTVSSLGNVGIAGTASISGDLYIGGLATASNAFVYVDTEGKLHAGDAYSDLSEFMPLASESFEAGDVITSRPATGEEKEKGLTTEPFIGVKSSVSYDQNLLGVVSYSDIPALGTKLNNNYLPISLAGRVPVKVSTENGNIEAGDYLTSSTKPGVAMKATKAGTVIGKALEPYENPDPTQVGRILMFVNSTWYGGKDSELTLNPDGSIDDKVTVESNGDFLSNLVSGLRQLGVDVVDGVIKATQLVVNEVKTKVLRISIEKDKDATVGSATIPAQQIEFRVNNSLVEANSKIFITFTSDTGARTWHISEKVPEVGFTIRLSDVTPEELNFDYWILQVEGSSKPTSDEEPTTPPIDSGMCGDNTVQPGEECDDGNKIDGDGCDATCMNEEISQPPADEISPPAEDETSPPEADETTPPAEEIVPPAEEVVPPVEEPVI
jgi:cysteine-rich repeat protein